MSAVSATRPSAKSAMVMAHAPLQRVQETRLDHIKDELGPFEEETLEKVVKYYTANRFAGFLMRPTTTAFEEEFHTCLLFGLFGDKIKSCRQWMCDETQDVEYHSPERMWASYAGVDLNLPMTYDFACGFNARLNDNVWDIELEQVDEDEDEDEDEDNADAEAC